MDSGAESTIEALYAILEAEQSDIAPDYFNYQKSETDSTEQFMYSVFRNQEGDQIVVVLDLKKSDVLFLEGEESAHFLASIER